MLTQTDLKQLKTIFVTKDEMVKIVADLMDVMKLQFQSTQTEMKALRNDIIGFKDEILHEISDLRDDVTVTTGYRDLIEDHEDRITKLEKTRIIY